MMLQMMSLNWDIYICVYVCIYIYIYVCLFNDEPTVINRREIEKERVCVCVRVELTCYEYIDGLAILM